jgi:hypothetical protein
LNVSNVANFQSSVNVVGQLTVSNAVNIIDTTNNIFTLTEYNDTDGAVIRAKRAKGTIAVPTVLQTNDCITGLRGFGYNGSAFVGPIGYMNIYASSNYSPNNTGTYITFGTTPSNSSSAGERIRITDNGNVGIGTSSPATKLDVNGTINIGSVDTNTHLQSLGQLNISANTTGSATYYNMAFSTGSNGNGNGGFLWYTKGGVSTGGTQKMSLDTNGNLTVAGTILASNNSTNNITCYTSGDSFIKSISTTTGWGYFQSISGSYTTNMYTKYQDGSFNISTQAGNTVTFGNNGDITTTATIRSVTLSNSGNMQLDGDIYMNNAKMIQCKNSTGGYELFVHPRWSDNVTYINFGSGGFNIRNNASSTVMFMQNGGNVGIGTLNPTYKLDVAGDINTNATIRSVTHSNSGNMQVGGSVTASTLVATGGISSSYGTIGNYPSVHGGAGFQTGWNRNSGGGRTDLCGYGQGGAGGFDFWYANASASNPTLMATMSPGSFESRGNIYIQNPSTNAVATTFLQISGDFIGDGSPNYMQMGMAGSWGAQYGYINMLKSGVAAQTGLYFQMSGTNVMYLNPSGNLGIGTNSPAYKLDVAGTVRIGANATNNKLLVLYDHGSTDALDTATNFYGFGINSGTLRYQVPSAAVNKWYSGTTNTMTLDGSGNISANAINTATGGSAGLLISDISTASWRICGGGYNLNFMNDNGGWGNKVTFGNTGTVTAVTFSGNISKNNLEITNAYGQMEIKSEFHIAYRADYDGNNSGMADHIFYATGNNERMRLTNAGNLGVGTSAPTAKLHVLTSSYDGSDPSYGGIYCYNPNAYQPNSICVRTLGGGNAFYSMDVAGVTGWSMGLHNGDGNKFKIKNNWSFTGSDIITLTSGGLVGIGTASPSQALDVRGNIYTNGYLYFASGGIYNNGDGFYRFVNNNTIYHQGHLILDGGNIGIGPGLWAPGELNCPLKVTRTTSMYSASGLYFNNSVGISAWNAGNYDVSIYSSGVILCGSHIAAASDKRIKTDIDYSIYLLDKVNKLKPCNFTYIDKIQKGAQSKYGFIAQDVEEIFPSCVDKTTDHIPDILTTAVVKNIIEDIYMIIIPKIGLNLKEKDNLKIVIKDKDDKYTFDILTVIETADSTEITINSKEKLGDQVFIIGRSVNDFRVLDNDQLISVAISAIQELDQKYTSKINILESQIATLIEQVNQLINK